MYLTVYIMSLSHTLSLPLLGGCACECYCGRFSLCASISTLWFCWALAACATNSWWLLRCAIWCGASYRDRDLEMDLWPQSVQIKWPHVQYFLRLTWVCLMCFIRCKSFSVILVSFLFSYFSSSLLLLCPSSSSLTSHWCVEFKQFLAFKICCIRSRHRRHPDFSVHDYRPTRNT